MCLSYYGFEEGDKALHMVAGTALLVALALKVAVVRRLHGLSRYLPMIGITVFALLVLTWISSAGSFSPIAEMDDARLNIAQLIGSLLVAAAIVAMVIVAVTAKLGPTSTAELEARGARDARIEAREERLEQREERREDRTDPVDTDGRRDPARRSIDRCSPRRSVGSRRQPVTWARCRG